MQIKNTSTPIYYSWQLDKTYKGYLCILNNVSGLGAFFYNCLLYLSAKLWMWLYCPFNLIIKAWCPGSNTGSFLRVVICDPVLAVAFVSPILLFTQFSLVNNDEIKMPVPEAHVFRENCRLRETHKIFPISLGVRWFVLVNFT